MLLRKVHSDHQLEKPSFIGHLLDLPKFQSLTTTYMSRGAKRYKQELSYRFEDARTAFGMPALNATVELLACTVDVVIVVLVVNRPCQAIAEHPFCERRQ